jgi:hypothetical protein
VRLPIVIIGRRGALCKRYFQGLFGFTRRGRPAFAAAGVASGRAGGVCGTGDLVLAAAGLDVVAASATGALGAAGCGLAATGRRRPLRVAGEAPLSGVSVAAAGGSPAGVGEPVSAGIEAG